MKKTVLVISSLLAAVVLLLLVINGRNPWRREPGTDKENVSSEKPFYTFKTCERHLGVLLYLFGDDPADWPEHMHYPVPGYVEADSDMRAEFAQDERDRIVYESMPSEQLKWAKCDRLKGMTGHVHPVDPKLAKLQHEDASEPDASQATVIGPGQPLEPLTPEEKERIRKQLDDLEMRIHVLRDILDLLNKDPGAAAPQERPAQLPWLVKHNLQA